MNSNKTIRLRTTPGESQNIQLKIEQEFDTLDILSLKITQDEAYQNFCSDYGVVVGRVIANDGFGVENAKISVFIPVTNEDQNNPRISSVYPYTTASDTNNQGIRYNLLPKQGKKYTHYQSFPADIDPNYDQYNYQTPFKGVWSSPSWVFETTNDDGSIVYSREVSSTYGPDVPTGTFPSKQEFLDNDILLEVYEKYYKLTTKTNASGDYMLFGVPVGNQTIHMDVDLSDAGDVSLTVEDFIDAGFPQQLFDITNKKFLSSTNLDSLPQIESRNISVEVVPFWGDLDQCEIGITRLDFNLNKTISPSSILIFQAFTNSKDSMAIRKFLCNIIDGNESDFTSIGNMKKIGVKVDTKSFDGSFNKIESFEDGNVFVTLPMYEERYITDEFGNQILSPDQNKGIPTSGRYDFHILPINDYITNTMLQGNSSNEGLGYASYQTPNDIYGSYPDKLPKFRYDLKNRKRKIYTLGNVNLSSTGQNRVTSIRGQANGDNVAYPVNFKDGGEKRFGQIIGNTLNNEPNIFGVCYGSLYFPRIKWGGDNKFCDQVAEIQESHTPYGLSYKSLKISQKYSIGSNNNSAILAGSYTTYMDITEIIKLFKYFNGGIQIPTSALLNIYNSENANPVGVEVGGANNQTIPLRNTPDNEIFPLNSLYPPSILNTDQKPYNNNIKGASTDEDYYITRTGRYYFYFGLKEDDNALTYLKQRLGE